MEVNVTEHGDTSVTLKVILPASDLDAERGTALAHLGSGVSVSGFRKGHIPEHVLAQHVESGALLREMANRVVSKALPRIIAERALRIVGRPSVSITKLAPGNPLEFTLSAEILPDVTLPDYKAIAARMNGKKPESARVTDGEIENAILEIQKRAAIANQQLKTNNKRPEEGLLPELTNEFVAKLGPYASVSDFRETLRGELRARKSRLESERHRLDIIEAIIAVSPPKLPSVLVEGELDTMLAQLYADLERAGLTQEQYLSQLGKTKEELRSEWRSEAEKRARIQLILNEIARAENIKADDGAVDRQTKALLAQYPPKSGDLKRAGEAARMYVRTMLTNEAVFSFLEQQEKQEDDTVGNKKENG